MRARRQGMEKRAERLKDALADAMDAQGRDKIKTALFSLSFRTSTRVEITDLTTVPSEYIKTRPLTEDDVKKTELSKYLRETGEVLLWARLEAGRSLQIK